jgi:transcription elongation factor SPT6
VNRDQFIRSSLLTTTLFLNAAAFLHINYDADTKKSSKYRQNDEADVADPLDNTRIHPEDYELARKMATDALELDEEDVLDEHPSHVISLLMQAHDKNAKLDELNLDDFAVNMFEANGDRKRKILSLIKDELINPFADPRTPKKDNEPGAWDVLTMLSGQTEQTLSSTVSSIAFPRTRRISVWTLVSKALWTLPLLPTTRMPLWTMHW